MKDRIQNQYLSSTQSFLKKLTALLCITSTSIMIWIGSDQVVNAQGEQLTLPELIFSWGSSGTDDGEFDYPRGLAIDSENNIYVADDDNNRIQKFDSSGSFITTWGSSGSGDGQFNSPFAVAVDSNDNVYVADNTNSRIQKFDSSGSFITQWGSYGSGDGQFAYPEGLTVDSGDNVYVADTYRHRIQKFDSSGSFITKWGANGSGDGQFIYPTDISTDSENNVYVVDSWNHRIQKFDSSGTFLAEWGTNGTDDGEFDYPNGIAIDSNDNIYVADRDNNRIQKFDSSGAFINSWSTNGPIFGELAEPKDITIDSDNAIYVSNWLMNSIEKYKYVSSTTVKAGYRSANIAVTTDAPGNTEPEFVSRSFELDNKYFTTDLSETNKGYDSQVFKLQPTTSCTADQNIAITWIGYGEEPQNALVSLSLWNVTDQKWDQKISRNCGSTCTISTNEPSRNYQDEDGYVWALMKADNSHISPPLVYNLDGSNLVFSWETNVPSDSLLCSDTVSHPSGTIYDYSYCVSNPNLVTQHSIDSSLNFYAGYFIARSCTATGECTTSDETMFDFSSCPFIFANNGNNFSFQAEAASAGILSLGAKLNEWKEKPFYTKTLYPNPVDYSRIPGEDLQPVKKGIETYYDIRSTFELNEVNYYDAASLLIYDHSPDVEIYPDYRNTSKMHSIAKAAKPPISVSDQDGNNVLEKVSKNDNVYWKASREKDPSYLTIKLTDDVTTPPIVKLAIKKGKQGDFFNSMPGDKLQYKNSEGEFVDVPKEMNIFSVTRDGAPAPSVNVSSIMGVETSVIDLSGLDIQDNEIRLVTTNDKTQWVIDWLAVDTNEDNLGTVTTQSPYSANLQFRGLSDRELTNPDDPEMTIHQPDYNANPEKVNNIRPLSGKATKYGEVKELLKEADDEYVIAVKGDELQMKFSVPEEVAGMERDFILYTWDYHKPYIYALGDTIEPLPFKDMSRYPYDPEEESYNYKAHKDYIDTYNTREIAWENTQSVRSLLDQIKDRFIRWYYDIVYALKNVKTQIFDREEKKHRSLNTDYISVSCSTPTAGNENSGNSENKGDFSPQIPQSSPGSGGGVYIGIEETPYSTRAVQPAVVILEPYSFSYDAYFSDAITSPVDSSGLLPNPVTGDYDSTKTNKQTVYAGDPATRSGFLGLKFGKTLPQVCWQISSIHNLWYKAYAPNNSRINAPKIIPELQSKPSIIALKYYDNDLIPIGLPNYRFNEERLTIANSQDGTNWTIMRNSTVDAPNNTVSAIDKVGGYYMIVSDCALGSGGILYGPNLP